MPLGKKNKKSGEKQPLPDGQMYPTQSTGTYPTQVPPPAQYNNTQASSFPPGAPPPYAAAGAPPPYGYAQQGGYGPPPPAYGQPQQQGYGPPPPQGYGPPQQQGPPQQGPPQQQGSQRGGPSTVVVKGGFDAGARFDGISQANIPPPPPGCAPNAAQAAMSRGENVVVTQRQGNFWEGGSDGGYVMF